MRESMIEEHSRTRTQQTVQTQNLRVGIVGCGTAGQSIAILLARAGHRVTIFERSPSLHPIGAGLLLQPSGQRVLERLGVLNNIAALGTPVHRLFGTTHKGRPVLDLHYPRDTNIHGIGIHRGALFQSLQQAVDSNGTKVHCGWHAVGLHSRGHERWLESSTGEHAGPFDLICIADGAKSHLRLATNIPYMSRQYPWGALWFVSEDRDNRFAGTLRQFFRNTTGMIGFLPSGRLRAGSPSTVSLFWSIRLDRIAATRAAGINAWKNQVRTLTTSADPLLDQITSIDDLITAAYFDVTMPRWDDDRVVILGDAGHAMSPQLGQGANLALMDSNTLADCLASSLDIPTATRRFSAIRCRNIRFYQFASRWLTPIFQSDHRWITPARDAFAAPLGKIPWVQRQMLESLGGEKDSWRIRRAIR